MNPTGIRAVASETGIHPSSLRRWEAIGLISCERINFGATGIRLYSAETVDLLKRVKRRMDEGYRLNPAFGKARAEMPSHEDSKGRNADQDGSMPTPCRLV